MKAIGVSNFKSHHLQRVVDATGVVPDVDQIQLSVDIARVEQRSFQRAHGILTEAWSPLGRGVSPAVRSRGDRDRVEV
ncbi:hypothetical protein AB1285_22995 [Microbacterium sp. NRRL B-14842]|uniref:hypothetical protein n=1 Tax=Microbacterium sp. NRRL B-14842 TaxID=3162881 RepID=UPI003D2D83FE